MLISRCLSPQVLQIALSACGRATFSSKALQLCAPVVIVGAGPTGLVLSSLLSQYGIQHMLFEKNAGLTQHPQAHYINNRTMEVFRSIPGLSRQVSDLSPPLSEWRRFIYCESMVSGQLLGEVDHFPGQQSACDAAVSPEPVAHLSQHRLAQLLLQGAQSLAAGANSSMQFNTQVKSVSVVGFPHQQPQHATQTYHHHHHQQQEEQQIHAYDFEDKTAQAYPVCVALTDHSQKQQQLVRCRYLVAADGSHSTIRRLLGIQMSGKAGMQHLISIHFSWPLLGQALLARGREGMLYFVFNRQVVAVLVAHNLQQGEFVAQVPYFPPLQSPAQFTPELCADLIQAAAGFTAQQQQQTSSVAHALAAAAAAAAAAAGGGGGGLQVHSIKDWVMSAEVADEYAAWDNRLLLAGDAAHRFPPAGGFGMNTGIQDAHNLAWKLAAVLTDRAEPALLASYQPERRPVAQANADLSVNNWHEAIRVPQALGLDPGAADLVNKVVSNVPLPAPVASWLLDAALTAGRGVANAVVPLRRGALQDILASGMSLRLQFPREDLGFVYSQGAVDAAAAGSQQQPAQGQQQGQGQQEGQHIGSSSRSKHRSNVYHPAMMTGGRLPHCWLQLLEPDGSLTKVSTLDVCSPDRLGLNMLLICTTQGSADSSQDWLAAGLQLQAQGWPLQALQVLPQGTQLDAGNAAKTVAGVAGSSRQPEEGMQARCALETEGQWAHLQGNCGSAAVLIRPDGHVAWRSRDGLVRNRDSSSSSQPAAGNIAGSRCKQDVLERVLRDVLCLKKQEC